MHIVRAISPSLCIIYFICLFSDKRLYNNSSFRCDPSFLFLFSFAFSSFFNIPLALLLLRFYIETAFSSSNSFGGIEPNGQALLRLTKLIFFNSSSRRSLTRGQPQGKSLKCCDGLTCYFGRPGAILTYLDIEAQHCPRKLAELIVFGTIILAWAVPQFLSNSKLIAEDPSLDVSYVYLLLVILSSGEDWLHRDSFTMYEWTRIRIRIELGPIWSQQIELFVGSIALGTRHI